MNIEIKPIGKRIITDGVHVVGIEVYKGEEVEELQANLKEAIESLAKFAKFTPPIEVFPKTYRRVVEARGIIEKATKKSWKELTE